MSVGEPVVVVGASLGGLRGVEAIRREGWDGDIIVVGAEPHLPYTRPPLSKALLLASQEINEMLASVQLRLRGAAAEVDWMLGRTAVSADLARHRITLDDGLTLSYSALVVATGLSARRLPLAGAENVRHVIRSLQDAYNLRRQLVPGARVVIIGAGFVGCEIALTSHKAGCDVTVVEPLSAPMERALGTRVGHAIGRRHEESGVAFMLGTTVSAFIPRDDARTCVRLTDGTVLAADVVVEAVGSIPNVDWLQGNGLDLSDGVLCDADLAVEGAPHVVAVGDVARFPNRRFDNIPRRVEHWQIASDTAKIAGRTLVADLNGTVHRGSRQVAVGPLPTFWSDQGELRLQAYGSPGLADDAVVTHGSLDDLDSGLAIDYLSNGELVAVVSINAPAALQRDLRTRVDAATLKERVANTAGAPS